MANPVTIHDIARELNLSAMTVSRVLNQRKESSVAPATRERVLKAAVQMGYRPNRNARALATGRTYTIGVWISHLRSSIYSQIADACRQEIQRAGLEAGICEMDWHFPTPETHPRILWPVDGILAVDPPQPKMLSDVLGNVPWQHTPRVNLGSGRTVVWEGDYARVDLSAGTRAAVEHLLQAGCRRIAYSVPAVVGAPGMEHYDAYTQVMREAGLRPEYVVHADWRCPSVRADIRAYVQAHGPPDGLFCHCDELAIAAFRALRDMGLRIPTDVALIGCEGNEFMEYFDPPLSTVAMPVADLCRAAWQLLQRRMEDPEAPAQAVILPYQLQARESSHRRV